MKIVNPKQTTRYTLDTADPILTFGTGTDIDVTTGDNLVGVYGAADVDWSVTNLGSISGATTLVFGGDATIVNGVTGKLSNLSGLTYHGVIYTGGVGHVTNAGSIVGSGPITTSGYGGDGAIYLAGGGTILNQKTGTIVGNVTLGKTGTITNAGSISNSGEQGDVLGLIEGGTVTNSGSIDLAGTHFQGIFLKNGGTVDNSGKITGSADYMEGILSEAGGTITNSGTIKLSASAHLFGIELESAGKVDNTGLISVTATTDHADGVKLGDGGTLTNSGSVNLITPTKGSGVYLGNGGTVNNLAGGSISAGAVRAIYAAGSTGATVTNAGTISSEDASISFANSGTSSASITNLLTLESGSKLTGEAYGSTGAFVTNDLVFKGIGTASNVFADFQNLTVDAGAAWTLSAAAGIAATIVEGSLTVAETGSLSGDLTLEGGTAIFKSAYNEDVTFDGMGELKLSDAYTGTISGLGAKDKIDFLDLSYVTGDKASVSGDVLTIETASRHELTTLTLNNSTYSSSNFAVGKDASGHILLSYT